MKKFIRKDLIEKLKNELKIFDGKEFIDFCSIHNINVSENKKDMFREYNLNVINKILNNDYGEEAKNDWINTAEINPEGVSPKTQFLNAFIYGFPFEWGHIKSYVNNESLNEHQKCLDVIFKNNYAIFITFLQEGLKQLDCDYSNINYLKVYNDLNELDKLKSDNYDLELIENFKKNIDTLISDGINIESILYVLKSKKYNDITKTLDIFTNDIEKSYKKKVK